MNATSLGGALGSILALIGMYQAYNANTSFGTKVFWVELSISVLLVLFALIGRVGHNYQNAAIKILSTSLSFSDYLIRATHVSWFLYILTMTMSSYSNLEEGQIWKYMIWMVILFVHLLSFSLFVRFFRKQIAKDLSK